MDLTTRYLGLDLPSPIVAGAGPLNRELDNLRRLEDLGAGAVVLPSIFEEQVEREERLIEELITAGTELRRGAELFPRADGLRDGSRALPGFHPPRE